MEKSNGDNVNPAPKKKSAMAEAWEAKRAVEVLMEKFGKADLDELMQELDQGATPQPTAEEPHNFGEPIIEMAAGPDPLRWIDETISHVGFVAKRSAFIVRPHKPNWNPPLNPMTLDSVGFGPWASMPFDITVPEEGMDRESVHVYETQQRAIWRNWHHFILTREFAEELYMDPRWPAPKTAVISVDDYQGWNVHGRRASGRATKLENPDLLRETVRLFLQRRMDIFLDANQCPVGTMNPGHPNPYNKANRLGNFGIHARHINPVETASELARVQGYSDYSKED